MPLGRDVAPRDRHAYALTGRNRHALGNKSGKGRSSRRLSHQTKVLVE